MNNKITPPNSFSSLGLDTQAWASGIFDEGYFAQSLRIKNSNKTDTGSFTESAGLINYSVTDSLGITTDRGPLAFTNEVPSNINQLPNGSEYVASDNITQVLRVTQVEYDAIPVKDPNILYIVVN